MNNADGIIIIGTEIDTSGVDKGVNEIKDEYKDEEIIFNTNKTSKGMKAISNLTKKIGRNMLGITASSAKFLVNIAGIIAKLGVIGGLISMVSLIGIGIANSFEKAIQKDEELSNKIKYLKFALESAFEPIGNFLVKVVKWLIDRLYDIMALLGAIIKSITGFNIFSKATANNFNKMNKNAEKLQKTLAGFDEMNILNEDGTTGIASKIAPMVDLQNSTKEVDTWINKTSEKFFNLGDELSSYLSKPNLFTKAYGVWDKFVHSIVRLFDGVYGVIRGLVDAVSGVIVTIYGIFTGNIELVKTGIKNLVKSIGTTFKGIIDVFKGIGGTIVGIFKAAFSGIWNGLVKGAKDAYNGVKNAFSPLASYFKTIFTNAWNGVKSVFSVGGQIYNGIKEGVTNAFKSIVNRLIDGINIFVGAPFKAINAMLNKIKNASVLGMKPFYWMWGDNPIKIPQIPRLAKGGIINMPGKGIPVGSAIGGERGQEGVIPLTDSQQMALLGEAIGRYITVNLTNVNEMNGRVLTRELKRIQNQNDFATNGR